MSRIQIIELNYWLKEKYVCGFSDVSRHEFYFISNFAFCLIAIVAVVVYVAMVVNVHCVPVHACAAERNSNLEKYIDKAKTSSTLQLKIKFSRYCFIFLFFSSVATLVSAVTALFIIMACMNTKIVCLVSFN